MHFNYLWPQKTAVTMSHPFDLIFMIDAWTGELYIIHPIAREHTTWAVSVAVPSLILEQTLDDK